MLLHPEDASTKVVVTHQSGDKIVGVDSNNVVSVELDGTTETTSTFTITSLRAGDTDVNFTIEGTSSSSSCHIHVVRSDIEVEQTGDLTINSTHQLIVKGSDNITEYDSSDSSVASVDSNGLVTALSAGTTYLSAKELKEGIQYYGSTTTNVV